MPASCRQGQPPSSAPAAPTLVIPASCNAPGGLSLQAVRVALRCLIVDDSTRFLEAARLSLSADEIDIVGTATTSADALRRVEELRPDAVLVDISLGNESGLELTQKLVDRHSWLGSRVVLISTRAEDDFADLIEASPAVGFLAKSQLSGDAIRSLVSDGG
jgi:DNA-binding NarL/FixJ family response regulator